MLNKRPPKFLQGKLYEVEYDHDDNFMLPYYENKPNYIWVISGKPFYTLTDSIEMKHYSILHILTGTAVDCIVPLYIKHIKKIKELK